MAALHTLTIDEELTRLRRGLADEVPKNGLSAALDLSRREKRPLRVKFGIDPSAPDLHLGHTVPLRKLRAFQELGHTVILLIGDFTAQIGDPTGQSVVRPQLTADQVNAHAKTYLDQVWHILDREKTEVRRNSEWTSAMKFDEVIRLAARYTVARILDREDFSKRLAEGKPIGVHEFLYPLVQGHDSVALRADIELCGTDQIFNCHVGRALQEAAGQPPEVILAVPLIEGTDGVAKMSKSKGNAIGITEDSDEMYGKVLSLPDALIAKYADLLLDDPLPAGLSPRDAKHALARGLVAGYHGAAAAAAAADRFEKVFVKHEAPENMKEVDLQRTFLKDGTIWILNLLTLLRPKNALVMSRNEAFRLVEQGAVELNQAIIRNPKEDVVVKEGDILRVGKHKFARVHLIE